MLLAAGIDSWPKAVTASVFLLALFSFLGFCVWVFFQSDKDD